MPANPEGAAPAPTPAIISAVTTRTNSLSEGELASAREALAALRASGADPNQIAILERTGLRAQETSEELDFLQRESVRGERELSDFVAEEGTSSLGSDEGEPPASRQGDRTARTGRDQSEPTSADAAGPGRRGVSVGKQARKAATAARKGGKAAQAKSAAVDDRARQDELEESEHWEDGEEKATRKAAGARRSGSRGAAGDYEQFEEGWFEGGQDLLADDDEDDFVDSGVPYDPGFKRPQRLLYGRGPIEAVNLYHRGEYEDTILGFKDLSVAAQYESKYLHPLVGRTYDVHKHLARALRVYRAGGDIEAELDDCVFETAKMFEMGHERQGGNNDRARTAAGHTSRGWTLDTALKLMLDARDDRMDRAEFSGVFGKAKRKMRNIVRTKELTAEANRLVYGNRRGGAYTEPSDATPPRGGAPAPAPTRSDRLGGGDGGGGAADGGRGGGGRWRGGGRGGGGRGGGGRGGGGRPGRGR